MGLYSIPSDASMDGALREIRADEVRAKEKDDLRHRTIILAIHEEERHGAIKERLEEWYGYHDVEPDPNALW